MADAALPAVSVDADVPMGPASGAGFGAQVSDFMAQPAVRKALPALVGLSVLAAAGALYMTIANGPSHMLYSSLSDGERAQVVATLEAGGISYSIDNATGAVRVAENDLYRARMLVASDGSLATPEASNTMLDTIPLGASRTLEGERLRLARERELMRTIKEIDGIESVRVHLATPARSVFIRDAADPSASVMLRLARGRGLEKSQVDAIVNLVAGSVPGMSSEDVRVVDQNGALLSEEGDESADALTLQRAFESKLREQVAQLLIPMLGQGNFSSEVQVELDMDESTSAREVYDDEGTIRSENESSSVRTDPGAVGGVPGVLANTPPPPAELVEEAPEATAPEQGAGVTDSQTSAARDYALDREVAVTSSRPGGLARLSVAVALSEEALEKIAPADEEQLQALISAAVGAQEDRGDQVTVMVGGFEPPVAVETPFYDTSWFAMALRYGGALLALLLVLLLGVRPLLAILRGDTKEATDADDDTADDETNEDEDEEANPLANIETSNPSPGQPHTQGQLPAPQNLNEQVALARQLAVEQPERAVTALQRMLINNREGA
ncbi:flagellar basal-body MS-ring/collar protein FliF [Qipengyuania sp. DGS5-3]|uniref:flagellar basal-body MS-ring/collar protein FliF n=1 Tax=Qipengyuania sp. DGS5-3 TaxID=3349632 RepID=UPI0036D2702C